MNKYHLVRTYVFTFYKRPFIIFLQTLYIATGSNLSWVELTTVELISSHMVKYAFMHAKSL